MSLLESIVYGLISGFSEFLPVSSLSHQTILMRLMGMSERDPIRGLIVHIAGILALLTACKSMFSKLRRERRLASSRRRGRSYAARGLYDLRLIRTAAIPLLICLLLTVSTVKLESNLVYIALFSVVNGIILIIPEYISHGNKDARFMSSFDGIMIGLCGALSVLPGISRIGTIQTYATIRGADKHHSLNWALLLSFPALILLSVLDVLQIVTGAGPISIPILVSYLFCGISAYIAAYAGILFAQFLTVRTGFTGFAYYSLGVALFSMILYLIA